MLSLVTSLSRIGLLLASIALAACHSAPDTLNGENQPLRLADCPPTPNCINSQQDGLHAAKPFILKNVAGTRWDELTKTVASLPRTTIIEQRDGYIRAESRSWLFRFIDDVELLRADDGKTVHIRSASRLGYSDMGVNGRRVELLRRTLQQQGVIE